jgi:RimJ/RimL family protein N-acetyltransferase
MGSQATSDSPDPLEPRQGEWHRRATLRDGTPVLLRQIRPEDRHRLAEGFRRLSPASRYLRFHTEMEDFTGPQLDYLTRVDHLDHEALVAMDLANPDIPGIGVARYIRDPDARDVAEAAVTVADEYHGQGAGTLLLGALAARAREQGIRVFRNYVLADNTAMLDVFDQLGAERELEADHLWRVDLALPEHERDLPDSAAGRAFMAAARDGLRLSSLLPPVWGRRPRGAKDDESDAGPDGIEAELASLRGELDTWLADREHRRPSWPADDEQG